MKLTLIQGNTLVISTQGGPGLWLVGSLSWINVSGVSELSTSLVLLVEVGSDGSGDSKEVFHGNAVVDVGVQVVLEVLEHVHVLVNVLESSNSWEGK